MRSKKIKGNIYYYWHQESKKEVYLGTADSIRRAMEMVKDRKKGEK